jgi:hypothetical protein
MSKIIFRALGVATFLGVVILLALLLAELLFHSHLTARTAEFLTLASAAGVALGTLVMIVHINVSASLSDSEKSKWRRNFLWRGPFVPAWYLWSVAGRDRPSRSIVL